MTNEREGRNMGEACPRCGSGLVERYGARLPDGTPLAAWCHCSTCNHRWEPEAKAGATEAAKDAEVDPC